MGNGMKEIVTSFPENSRKVSWGTGYFRSELAQRGQRTGGGELSFVAQLTIWPPCFLACVKMPWVLLPMQ